ncbi:Spo11/DNA topoisomerase VI subunit A [Fusarium flagelliforme]|uniref:Spo11/DNA topoisomerase VI subunit A n=1 Tax=Fusarium flagelliforme TaxID=2675880 RepID=UPI001E8CE5EF|nr:Spo11/DNA topoisomerase VI subunit A [Fusarium flagelliforme]KAH7191988.1 Spo11/DNA topoisomerase VI subunit A [Fusarium flagelliforme]
MDEEMEISQIIATPELTRNRQTNLPSSATVNDTNTNTITSNTNVGTVVARIEGILEQIIDALAAGQELSIGFSPRRAVRQAANASPERVHFPGRNQQEAIKFTRILLILQLSHDALVSGTVLTKRHIFYQHQDLFEKQREVDDLVDDIAFNLGIGRADLNIVAASKGLLAGHLTIGLQDGSTLNPSSGDLAVFRSLCSSQFWRTSLYGPGILITAKGYPDLTTRSFLNLVNTRHPQLSILGLFDYDPDGVKIMRCYRDGSNRLGHETDLNIQGLQWLGIKSAHLFRDFTGARSAPASQSSQTSITSTACRDPVTYMSTRERKATFSTLKKVSDSSSNEIEVSETVHELQMMMALGVKAEIEWLDESGDLCSWLDDEIGEALISDMI